MSTQWPLSDVATRPGKCPETLAGQQRRAGGKVAVWRGLERGVRLFFCELVQDGVLILHNRRRRDFDAGKIRLVCFVGDT